MAASFASQYSVPLHSCKICKLEEQKEHDLDEPDNEASKQAAQKAAFMKYKTKAGVYNYGVSIMNGKQEGAASGSISREAFICLVGTNGHSGKLYLQGLLSWLHSDIQRNNWVDMVVESSGDLGEILVVILGIGDHGLLEIHPSWYVNEVGVYNTQNGKQDAFPCYHWIGKGDTISISARTATLSDDEDQDILLTQRQTQLQERQEKYVWKKLPEDGLPSCIEDQLSKVSGLINDLPVEEQFERVKEVDFTGTALKDSAALLLQAAFIKMTHLHDYEVLATVLGNPELSVHNAGRWTNDVEFGRQILNGVNPVVIRRCTKLPINFPVINDMVKGSLNRGKTLDEEIKDGYVYICDLKIMDGLPTREGQYSTAPLCLLYVNGDGNLVPIAIQLKQEKGDDNPIFLPSDHLIDWLLAKMYYQSAHGQFHQLSTHYFSCHAAMEAYAVATMRNLPDPHPVYKILRPHFRYTMAINTSARASLINNGGVIDQLFAIGGEGTIKLFQLVSEQYRVHWTNIVQFAKERGVDDPEKLPGYYYRDDGIKIWEAIKKFVSGVIDEFYKTDKDVKKDEELKNWAEDIHTNAFPGYFGAEDGHGFPKQILTKKDLTEYCTLIMFTGSAQHASINFGQYTIYGFVPNAPLTLRQPPPREKGVADYSVFLQSLPEKKDAATQVAVVNMLSQYSQDEIYLGDYPSGLFSELTVLRLIASFQRELDDIAGDIYQRNKSLDVPYTFMLPNKIPNSITI